MLFSIVKTVIDGDGKSKHYYLSGDGFKAIPENPPDDIDEFEEMGILRTRDEEFVSAIVREANGNNKEENVKYSVWQSWRIPYGDAPKGNELH